MNAVTTRLEHDLLGDREVPSAAYYGVHTLRALENFDITFAKRSKSTLDYGRCFWQPR